RHHLDGVFGVLGRVVLGGALDPLLHERAGAELLERDAEYVRVAAATGAGGERRQRQHRRRARRDPQETAAISGEPVERSWGHEDLLVVALGVRAAETARVRR